MTLNELNHLEPEALYVALEKCCGSSNWIVEMMNAMPFNSKEDLLDKARLHWNKLRDKDGLEAFTHHPKIGDLEALEKKFASTKDWSENEQGAVNTASKETLIALAEGNTQYEEKFGYIFIVCATGKSAEEMLTLLNARLPNTKEEEIKIAMKEQEKITQIRLEKLLV